jgi:Tol biopolymer transport system component
MEGLELKNMKRLILLVALLMLCLPSFATQYRVTSFEIGSGEIGYPSWSPDGNKIAFHRYVGGKFDIYTISSAGGGLPTKITSSSGWNRYPAWSPDGTNIAFVNGNNDPPWQIRTVTLATGQETVITDGYDPAWSPDGEYIVFARGNTAETNLWKRELDTDIETQLTSSAGIEQNPDWSHDGQTIVYNYGDVTPSIWTVPAAGGSPIHVPLAYGYGPKWSPDDARIAIEAGNDLGGYSIYVFNMMTHNLFQATPDSTEWCMQPDWSPDGGKIAFYRMSNIWVVTYGENVKEISIGRLKALYK